MLNRISSIRWLSVAILALWVVSCSHKYNSNELDLSFYQWNMWAGDGVTGQEITSEPAPPECGWEEFNRGVGKLVRIPATFDAHFSSQENKGVLWYHCRFTLPDLWEGRTIHLYFEEAGPRVDLFLNEKLVDDQLGHSSPFEVDISQQVYYVRDNHLAIKVTDPEPGSDAALFGISGKIVVKSIEKVDSQSE